MSIKDPSYLFPTYICLDVGGTSIHAAYFLSSKTQSYPLCLFKKSYSTKKGKKVLCNQLLDIINEIDRTVGTSSFKNKLQTLNSALDLDIDEKCLVSSNMVSISMPGNFDDKGRLKPGSAENLGTFDGEFDLFSPKEELMKLSPEKLFFIQNDALAQCLGSYIMLLDRKLALEETFHYGFIGIGTGLGGAFLDMSENQYPMFYTDGHIFDLEIPSFPNEPVENILSHRGIIRLTGFQAKELNTDVVAWNKSKEIIESVGRYIAELIYLIQSGMTSKKGWSEEDTHIVSEFNTYILGGSIGCKGRLGKTILSSARSQIYEMGIDVKIYQAPDPDHAALLGSCSYLDLIYKAI
ncbi:ROK family protein [bacterium]|nr:ROK family protein [bacterium]